MYESREVSRLFCIRRSHLLSGRPCIWLPGNRLGCDDVLLGEALLDELLQVSLESPIMDGLVPFAVVVGAVLRPGQ